MNRNISDLIYELVEYGKRTGLVEADDEIYCSNRLLELFEVSEYRPDILDYASPSNDSIEQYASRPLHLILEDMLSYAVGKGLCEDTTASKDLFDTKIMGLITPAPSVVRKEFASRLSTSAKAATDYYYNFSKATNYIRTDRIAKDIKWTTDVPYGTLDITINLSKPEKDPRDIANALKATKSSYPKCLLCKENEGYAGTLSHPARQNHRIIPITLGGEQYYMQYSPYVYYNEHCIIFNEKHTPMKIDHGTFVKFMDFLKLFPHYTIGSNADLPIVGGSILTHDHFQGGCYEFPMVRAEYKETFKLNDFPDIKAGIINWPLSTIRLQSKNPDSIVAASDKLLDAWRNYTDEDAYIFAYTDEDGVRTPHNTITPIARMRGDLFEIDLVLRNNITTKDCPMGLYHPHKEYHHIKKENIGLIEVMGLAILPARLKTEFKQIAEIINSHASLSKDAAVDKIYSELLASDKLAPHGDWVKGILIKGDSIPDSSQIDSFIQKECGIVFSHVLEDAGVFKLNDNGIASFMKFIDIL